MSQVYNLEPPTDGKLCLHTSFGEIDIELWPREAPLACRNFVQHSLDGYYDGTIFHRIISKFMIQGGDPTGVGDGGNSSFEGGAPFKDEFHTRLKFNHRGLIAMAHANETDANGSQFFLTLDSCEWLNKKHTIFGKVVGQTVFNMLRMGDMDVDASDRPVDPPRLERVTVLANPFDDVVARDVAAGKGKGAEGERDSEAVKRRKKRKKVNDRTLLSFGDDEEDELQEATAVLSAKMTSMHDSAAALTSERISGDVAPEVAADASDATGAGARGVRGGGSGVMAPKPFQSMEAKRKALRAAVAGAAGVVDRDDADEDDDDGDNDAGGRKQKGCLKKDKAAAIANDEEDEEYRALQARMREENNFRGQRMGARDSSSSSSKRAEKYADVGGEETVSFDSDEGEGKAGVSADDAKLAQTRAEYAALRKELASSALQQRGAQASGVMKRAKEREQAAAANDSLLTPLQQQRDKFVQRNKDKDLSSRQKDTMAALEAFTSKLKSGGVVGGVSDGTVPSTDGGERHGDGSSDEVGDGDSDTVNRAAKKEAKKQAKKEKKAAKKDKRAAERVDSGGNDDGGDARGGGGGGGSAEASSGYHGQVTEQDALFGGESDDDGADWFSGKLKFKKHIDDKFRNGGSGGGDVGADGRSTGDYVTLDSRLVNIDALDDANRKKKEPPRDGDRKDGGYDRRRDDNRVDRRNHDHRDRRRDDDHHRRDRSRSRSRGRGDDSRQQKRRRG